MEEATAPYQAAFLLMAETGMRIGEVVHPSHDDRALDGPTPVTHIRPKEVVLGARPWRPKNGEQRAVPLSPRAVAMLRDLPRCRRWVIDRMDGTAARPPGVPPNAPGGGRASAQFQHSRAAVVAGRAGDQHSFSTVTEVKHDTLFKEPWKQGPFDSTIPNQRRGRDSNPRSSF